MSDIALTVQNGRIDVDIVDGDLRSDDGLETAVLISLFTDQRVTTEELPQGQSSRRGWWGDLFPDFDGDQIGSKLWLLNNAKQVNRELPKYETYVRQALEWLIEDGVASDILVTAQYPERGQVEIQIDIQRVQGESSRFGFLWDGQELRRG